MIGNKTYFIDQINSSKAYKMTSLYHYSGVGFKKATLNLGVFRQEDKKLVGVLQWGISYQDGIKLNRYVKEPIDKTEYLATVVANSPVRPPLSILPISSW